MPTTTTYSQLALTYAQSLLDLAGDQAEAIGQELTQLREVLEQTPSFGLYLADPAIGQIERGEMLKKLFEGRASQLLVNFLRVMNNHGRLNKLTEVIGAYDELLEEKLGKIEVDLTVARPLSPEQLKRAQEKISQALKRDAVVHTYVDESIIGGMIIRVQDQLIDASVRAQLQSIKRQMLAKMPK
jgi:F-type H+-transporting ATPase subunit delta